MELKKGEFIITHSNTKLLNWSIKDDLANFNSDLLVDGKLEGLLKNEVVYQGTPFIDSYAEANYPYQIGKEIKLSNL